MFTTTLDLSLDRWTKGDREFAYTYDGDTENPFSWGWTGLCMIPDDVRFPDAGDIGVVDEYTEWHRDLGDIEYDITMSREMDDTDTVEALTKVRDQHEEARPEIIWFDHAGYRVYVDVPEFSAEHGGDTDEEIEKYARGMADTYVAWATGQVFVAGVTDENGDTEYLGGIYLSDDKSAREQIEEIMADFI